MSGKSVRRAALALLVAVLLGVAAPIPASARSGKNTTATSFFAQVWDWLRTLLPDPVRPAGDGDAGHGVDPNG